MGMELSSIVPWGRSYEEYVDMFSLSQSDLKKSILGCGDGPAAFNAVHTKNGGKVLSVDPVYEFSADEISQRISETYSHVIQQLIENSDDYVWESFRSVEELGQARLKAMKIFLEDFLSGKREGRYLARSAPNLQLALNSFGLALSSHFLFLYEEKLSLEFHLETIGNILRYADELRIFPLLTLASKPSKFVSPVIKHFSEKGFTAEIQTVSYEFQKGANQLLTLKRQS